MKDVLQYNSKIKHDDKINKQIVFFNLKDFDNNDISFNIRSSKEDKRLLILEITQKLNDRSNLELFIGFIDSELINKIFTSIKEYKDSI